MKTNKFFGKKSALYALVAATAALGMASVGTTAQASSNVNLAHTAITYIHVNNNTNGCVRVYSSGYQMDIPAHKWHSVDAIAGRSYMASVYKYGCGGAALRNVWYTANNRTGQAWNIY
jgi:hypothetical protein